MYRKIDEITVCNNISILKFIEETKAIDSLEKKMKEF